MALLQDDITQDASESVFHSCWAVLLTHLAAAGDACSVLRALDSGLTTQHTTNGLRRGRRLLTPRETEDLVESAHKVGLHGE